MDRAVAEAVERLSEGDRVGARTALEPLFESALANADARDRALASVLEAVDHADPRVGAAIATIGGAFVEEGAAPRPLARAVIAPFRRALELASPFVELAALLPEAGEDDENPVDVRHGSVSATAFDALAVEHPEGAAAFASLDTWYMAVAAGWTRDTATLREVQGDASLRASVDALATEGGIIWIANLLRVPFDAPLVVAFPELDEAWSVRMTGISDTGQLCVLLSHSLEDPLRRLGSEPAEAAVLSCMSGAGPQHVAESYAAAFQLYPWEALDLASGFPKSGLFEWSAPGGVGDHSLPADFWPGSLAPVAQDMRVVFAVGPDAPGGMHFTRLLNGARAFSGLRAQLDGAKRLSTAAAKSCIEAVRIRVKQLRHH